MMSIKMLLPLSDHNFSIERYQPPHGKISIMICAFTCEPCHEKTFLRGFRPGPTQEARNFGSRKLWHCTICEAKTRR